jgi:5-methylcytosine-specific restriction protein A
LRRNSKVGERMKAEEFKAALDRILEDAQRHRFADVTLGNLHREVGGYPGPDHRMPVCCAAMRSAMCAADRVLSEPPKRNGASLTIRYVLPR